MMQVAERTSTAVDSKPQGGDTKSLLPNPRRRACRQVCPVVCVVLLIVAAFPAYYAVRFGVTLARGMAYMDEMRHQTVAALSINGVALQWYRVNDVVMGGHSTSEITRLPDGGLNFSGVISTRDGGFASCSTVEQPLRLPTDVSAFNVTVTGNGELFKFTLKTSSSVWDPMWQADLPAASLTSGVRHSFVLPLSRFKANRMGRPVPDARLVGPEVVSLGFNLALIDENGDPNPHFRDGPFELLVHSVSFVADGSTAYGSCRSEVQAPLRWGADRFVANRICCHNRDYAEQAGSWLATSFAREASQAAEVTFYDSVTGVPLFVAPRGRSMDAFLAESRAHGWPSFRDEEVLTQHVVVRPGGETVSTSGTHLGHNLPDERGNRYCINLVSVAGNPAASRLAALAPASSPPPAPIQLVSPPPAPIQLASFGQSSGISWRVTNDPVMGGRSRSSLAVSSSSSTFSGTCAIVPFLRAPGFCKMTATGSFADASPFFHGGALHVTLRSSTPTYAGFKLDFQAAGMHRHPGQRHGTPAFKAALSLPSAAPAGELVTVRVPWDNFSSDHSEYTGRCDTKDPGGLQHHCCSAAHPENCPTAANLASIVGMSVWAEGVEGNFDLELHSIAAGP